MWNKGQAEAADSLSLSGMQARGSATSVASFCVLPLGLLWSGLQWLPTRLDELKNRAILCWVFLTCCVHQQKTLRREEESMPMFPVHLPCLQEGTGVWSCWDTIKPLLYSAVKSYWVLFLLSWSKNPSTFASWSLGCCFCLSCFLWVVLFFFLTVIKYGGLYTQCMCILKKGAVTLIVRMWVRLQV